MKTLWDLRNYAYQKGLSDREIERLIDQTESDGGNGNISEQYFNEICFGIDCEVEEEREEQ